MYQSRWKISSVIPSISAKHLLKLLLPWAHTRHSCVLSASKHLLHGADPHYRHQIHMKTNDGAHGPAEMHVCTQQRAFVRRVRTGQNLISIPFPTIHRVNNISSSRKRNAISFTLAGKSGRSRCVCSTLSLLCLKQDTRGEKAEVDAEDDRLIPLPASLRVALESQHEALGNISHPHELHLTRTG